MRKNLLALSIAAMVGGLSGAANAAVINNVGTTATGLSINPQGVGHILAVPYFSTQGNNKTLLSITNTDTTNGKAVKLRFRGAANSDDIFDITVFLSPGDMNTVMSKMSSELDAPRKRSLTALPLTVSVLTMFNRVLLFCCVVK